MIMIHGKCYNNRRQRTRKGGMVHTKKYEAYPGKAGNRQALNGVLS